MEYLRQWRNPYDCCGNNCRLARRRSLTPEVSVTSCSGPVIADEAHEARAAACQQTNNTAEVCGIIEALQFFMTLGLVPRDSRVLHFPGPHSMPPMYALVPHQHGPTFDWLGLVSTFSYRYNCVSLSLCVTSNATEIMLGMSVQIRRRHSKPLDLCPTTTLSNAGRSRCSVLPIS